MLLLLFIIIVDIIFIVLLVNNYYINFSFDYFVILFYADIWKNLFEYLIIWIWISIDCF